MDLIDLGSGAKLLIRRFGIHCFCQMAGDKLGLKPNWEGVYVGDQVHPKCLKCEIGQLVPLSDYGGQGAAVHYKAWVCINPDCGFNLKIRNGDIYP